jgi:hypothetical protein
VDPKGVTKKPEDEVRRSDNREPALEMSTRALLIFALLAALAKGRRDDGGHG